MTDTTEDTTRESAPDAAEEDARIRAVLADAVSALDAAGVPYLAFGGLAAVEYGRWHSLKDADVFLKAQDADRALETLAGAGFDTKVDNPNWLYKSWHEGVLVDLIFQVKGDIYLDDEMLERGRSIDVDGRPVRLIAPEDAVLIEAASHGAETPTHWHNALAIISNQDLDWAYLGRRARISPRRALALLVYAQSSDLAVPDENIRALYARIYADGSAT